MESNNANIVLTIPELINIITTINLLIMFAILFFRKQNTNPNKILAIILLLPGVSYINNYLILSGLIYQLPSIVFISQISALLCAPLIYHYVRMFMGKKKNILSIWHAFSIITITICIYYWMLFLYKDTAEKNEFVTNIINSVFPKYLVNIRGSFFILFNIYFIDISYQIWMYSKKLMNIKSELEQVKIRYLYQFMIVLWTLNIIILILYAFLPNFYIDYMAVPIITIAFYIFLLKTSFNHAAIFTKNDFITFKQSVSQINEVNLEKVSAKELSNEEVENTKKKINYYLHEKKLFTDPDINIVKFADMIGQTVHQTSFFINKYLNTNFYNLINTKRIELAKQKMKQRGTDSEIEIIGYEVGFNSKSAFYRAFNKYVQKSPSDFIQSEFKN